jgi:hypothetical protein
MPFFTVEGKIEREVKLELQTDKKTLYYGCSLPKDNILWGLYSTARN